VEQLIRFIAQSLVEFPEQVDVRTVENDNTLVIELRVASSDMGKVIGKQGRIAKSLRTILKSVSAKESKKVMLEIM
jgi:predicted RNA-binding protein YlqC (UPF0109 family)